MSGNTASILYNGEDYRSDGNALTRYFTKPVNLAEGFDACDLTVYFDAIRPTGSSFHVYYKILPSTSDNARFEDQSWRLMEAKEGTDELVSDSRYLAFEYKTKEGCAMDATTDTTDKFGMFAVKVVMATNDTTYVPTIKNFRAIALDSKRL
jgi:hypothetical protein